MSANKKPVHFQRIVLSMKIEGIIARSPGTRGQSDIVPESL
jgi:hypothetical protein